MMLDIVIPSSVVGGLFLINVLVVLLIRKRRKSLQYDSIESMMATKSTSIDILTDENIQGADKSPLETAVADKNGTDVAIKMPSLEEGNGDQHGHLPDETTDAVEMERL